MAPNSPDILMPGIVHADDPARPYLENNAQHLSCFVGGMLALGGKLTQNTTHLDLGRKVTDGCIWAYKSSPLGIMPEWFKLFTCPSHAPCPWDAEKWSAEAQPGRPPGFIEISDPRYILRPEAIESVFYLYRITGEQKYQDAAWEMWQAIDRVTKTNFANAALKDITKVDGGLEDSMESFWMAETLKYFYLIFSEPGVISLDDYVFNTEAHPFKLRE
jgi:mannosyl-oligosaccharide alpha-1,2-mannosidase